MSSFKDEEFDFEWPLTMNPITQASNTRESIAFTTKSFVSTTVEAILMEKSKETSSESPDYNTSAESLITTILSSEENMTKFGTTFATEVPQNNSYMGSTFDKIGGLFETKESITGAASETPIASTTSDSLKDMFKSLLTSQKVHFESVNTEEPMFDRVTNLDDIKNLLTNVPTEKPFISQPKTITETQLHEMQTNTTLNTIREWLTGASTETSTFENGFSTKIFTDEEPETPFVAPAGTTTTVNTIKDWISQTSNEKTMFDSHTESPTIANTLKSTLETTFTEFSNATEEQFQLIAKKTTENITESPISTMKTFLEVLNNEKTPFEATNNTSLIKNIYTDVENTQDMHKTMYDWGETTNFTTAGKTATEFFSTVTSFSNITTGETNESSNLLDSNKDIVIYIVMGVILIGLILLFTGIYLCCKRCKKEQEIKGEYYVSQLKDYSDSSGKSPETMSDIMVNIKL